MLYLFPGNEPKDHGLPRTVSDSSLDEDDIDMLTDAESDKDIFRSASRNGFGFVIHVLRLIYSW